MNHHHQRKLHDDPAVDRMLRNMLNRKDRNLAALLANLPNAPRSPSTRSPSTRSPSPRSPSPVRRTNSFGRRQQQRVSPPVTLNNRLRNMHRQLQARKQARKQANEERALQLMALRLPSVPSYRR